ncbi:hypothetical protein C2G38_2032903 [Gigaspora rosea]|uniref:Galactose oxidase n=1 Tax=Gigaspora rosea TaxID=44941 RepID=A0A397VL95_9GLOM|nr:hypothetical protein C2G38_2032903 [Gigaspora rosea]
MNDFFYLDLSKPFTITDNGSMPWIDLTYTGGPLKDEATACIGRKNNDMIFIFGGFLGYQPFVNQFDTSKQQWSNITSVGNVPTNRYDISCANFDNGLIAIFSGMPSSNTISNDLWVFNTLTLTWSLSNATNAPLPMFGYRAVTLPDGNILYIGGNSLNLTNYYMPLNNSISGPTPPAVRYFSTVLSVFVNGTFPSKIFMLDVSRKDSYKWVTEFTPNTTITTTTTPTATTTPTTTTTVTTSLSNASSESKNTSIIIGAIIGSIISLIIFVIASILTLKFIDKQT